MKRSLPTTTSPITLSDDDLFGNLASYQVADAEAQEQIAAIVAQLTAQSSTNNTSHSNATQEGVSPDYIDNSLLTQKRKKSTNSQINQQSGQTAPPTPTAQHTKHVVPPAKSETSILKTYIAQQHEFIQQLENQLQQSNVLAQKLFHLCEAQQKYIQDISMDLAHVAKRTAAFSNDAKAHLFLHQASLTELQRNTDLPVTRDQPGQAPHRHQPESGNPFIPSIARGTPISNANTNVPQRVVTVTTQPAWFSFHSPTFPLSQGQVNASEPPSSFSHTNNNNNNR